MTPASGCPPPFNRLSIKHDQEASMLRNSARRRLAICLLTTCVVSLQSFTNASALRTTPVKPATQEKSVWTATPEADAFINEERDGNLMCGAATASEALGMTDPGREQMMHVISPAYQMMDAGSLNITLRGTAQLDSFPQARDAFLRAAENWKQKIQAPISIIIDVDFGPTRFGQSYPSGVLGSTSSQGLSTPTVYSVGRFVWVNRAATADDQAIVSVLPGSQVPTDLGSTAGTAAPSAMLRALGVIGATA